MVFDKLPHHPLYAKKGLTAAWIEKKQCFICNSVLIVGAIHFVYTCSKTCELEAAAAWFLGSNSYSASSSFLGELKIKERKKIVQAFSCQLASYPV